MTVLAIVLTVLRVGYPMPASLLLLIAISGLLASWVVYAVLVAISWWRWAQQRAVRDRQRR